MVAVPEVYGNAIENVFLTWFKQYGANTWNYIKV